MTLHIYYLFDLVIKIVTLKKKKNSNSPLLPRASEKKILVREWKIILAYTLWTAYTYMSVDEY